MTTTVKHFHSAMIGAPVLSGTAGSLIAVLDACLKDGFGLKTADSVVVSGGIATANFSTGHSFEPDVIALAAGATPSGLNGEKRVLTTTTNAITFDATGIADGTATGTITFKVAPAGWEKPFSGTNLAVYRSADVTSTRMFLRVDDTGTTNARVVGYESMSDVNTGVRAFPLSSQISGGGYWPKANATNATARAWTIIADTNVIYLHMNTPAGSTGMSGSIWGFGDFDSLKSGDPFACFLNAHSVDAATSISEASESIEYWTNNPVSTMPAVPRSFTGLGGSVRCMTIGEYAMTSSGASGALANAATPTYPNGANNGLILSKKLIIEQATTLRGRYRGVLLSPQNCHTSFNGRDKVDGQGDLAGRKLLAVKCGSPASNSSQGVVFFDITGPWV